MTLDDPMDFPRPVWTNFNSLCSPRARHHFSTFCISITFERASTIQPSKFSKSLHCLIFQAIIRSPKAFIFAPGIETALLQSHSKPPRWFQVFLTAPSLLSPRLDTPQTAGDPSTPLSAHLSICLHPLVGTSCFSE